MPKLLVLTVSTINHDLLIVYRIETPELQPYIDVCPGYPRGSGQPVEGAISCQL